jgi:hypothetical protein
MHRGPIRQHLAFRRADAGTHAQREASTASANRALPCRMHLVPETHQALPARGDDSAHPFLIAIR